MRFYTEEDMQGMSTALKKNEPYYSQALDLVFFPTYNSYIVTYHLEGEYENETALADALEIDGFPAWLEVD